MSDHHQVEPTKLAKTAIIIFGFISLFGDIIYEGARSSIPTLLEILETPAIVVGLAIGLGEFLGYSLRLVSGYVADTTKAYWALTAMGYGLIIAIPLLAFAYSWKLAIILVVLERVGKAIRTPARDTLISVTTSGIGRGKAFGLHELFDQIGATVGPLIMASIIYYTSGKNYEPLKQLHTAFLFMFIPYVIMIMVLFSGYLRLREPTADALKMAAQIHKEEKLGKNFYFYSLAVMLNTAGLLHIALILYLSTSILEESLWLVPLLYLFVQGIDAVSAPISGAAYDKHGIKVLLVPFFLSVLPTLFISLVFIDIISISPIYLILLATGLFGVILGMQESIYRAAVADLTGISKRGTGYGIFNTVYGLGFLVSGVVMGFFLDMAAGDSIYMLYAIIYSVVMQAIAIILLKLATGRTMPSTNNNK